MIEMSNYTAASTTMERFVVAVKAKMTRDGVSQTELAKRLGITQPQISERLALKRGNLSFNKADEIAAALGTSTVDLLNGFGQ
jgi:transcriptional regulator with XRE-family HTH domain